MATLKDIQRKIGAVKKTQKITKAMNMVAASKLRGAQEKMEAFRPYANKFAEVLGSLAERIGAGADEEHLPPLIAPREEIKTVDLLLMTSDRGLCGSFNTNLIAKAQSFLKEKGGEGVETRLLCMGRKGRDYFRRRKQDILSDYIGIVGARFGFNVAVTTGQGLIDSFLNGETDEVYMIFSEFVSMAKQVPTVKQLLPIAGVEEVEGAQETAGYIPEHICEPSAEELMAEMLPKQVYVQVFSGLLETSTSEHAARMAAMDNATSNCADMITSLTLVYNKARQAAITAELMDIVGGAEALKG